MKKRTEPRSTYTYRGKKYFVNALLLKQRNVSVAVAEEIIKLHKRRLWLYDYMGKALEVELPQLAQEVEDLECELQELWGFRRDRTKHRWFMVPRCSCPKMDNGELLGTEYRIVFEDCPVHKDWKNL